jgi:hypothetical protein
MAMLSVLVEKYPCSLKRPRAAFKNARRVASAYRSRRVGTVAGMLSSMPARFQRMAIVTKIQVLLVFKCYIQTISELTLTHRGVTQVTPKREFL